MNKQPRSGDIWYMNDTIISPPKVMFSTD